MNPGEILVWVSLVTLGLSLLRTMFRIEKALPTLIAIAEEFPGAELKDRLEAERTWRRRVARQLTSLVKAFAEYRAHHELEHERLWAAVTDGGGRRRTDTRPAQP